MLRESGRSLSRIVLAGLALLSLAIGPSVALGQPLAGGGVSMTQSNQKSSGPTANDLFLEGMDQVVAGRIEAGHDLLQKSLDTLFSHRVLAYLIILEGRLKQCGRAHDRLAWLNPRDIEPALLEELSAQFLPDGPCAGEGVSAQAIADLYQCDVHVRVESDPPGAIVQSSQRGARTGFLEWGTTPIERGDLCPGDLQLSLRMWRYQPAYRSVRLAPHAKEVQRIQLVAYERKAFLNGYRKTAALGVTSRFVLAGTEGTWRGEPAFTVGPALSTWFRNFRLTGELHYWNTPEGIHHGAVGRGTLEYALPLVYSDPRPTLDTRTISVFGGLGGEVSGWSPRSVGASVHAGLHLYWLTLGGYYTGGLGLWDGRIYHWSAGALLGLFVYL
jgi:hypothetical protein